MELRLDIYVEPDCTNCGHAIDLASRVRAEIPDVHVSVIDITLPDVDPPQSVFAVPTYMLNGRTISLGNPAESELLDQLKSEIQSISH